MQPSLASQVALPAVGERVGRYEIVAPIAEGGMAGVFVVKLASMAGFEKLLAMKVLLPHLRKDRRFVDMFLDEARIAATVHHPSVVQVFELGEHEGTPFLVMELLRGQSLHAVMKRHASMRRDGRALPLAILLHVLARAAEGLHAAHETVDDAGHSRGIVHRDVSPQNVHVGYDGSVRVIDFGIAAARGRLTETRSGEIKGKLQYLAPEQLRHEVAIDRRADVWALGVMAWESVANAPLFRGADDATTLYRVLNAEVPPLASRAPEVPAVVAEVVDRCLRRPRVERPKDCRELADAFEAGARALGCRGTSDVVATLSALFAGERAVEDEHLSRVVRAPSGAGEAGTVVSEIRSSRTDADLAELRGARSGWVVAVLGVALLVAAAWAFVARPWEESPVPEPEAETEAEAETETEAEAEPEAEAAPVPVPVPPVETITLEVDPRARLVLVDGQRRDERPIVVELEDDQRATVELVSPTGEVVRHEVGLGDDGARLSLGEPAGATKRTRVRRMAPMGGAMDVEGVAEEPSSPLLGDPY